MIFANKNLWLISTIFFTCLKSTSTTQTTYRYQLDLSEVRNCDIQILTYSDSKEKAVIKFLKTKYENNIWIHFNNISQPEEHLKYRKKYCKMFIVQQPTSVQLWNALETSFGYREDSRFMILIPFITNWKINLHVYNAEIRFEFPVQRFPKNDTNAHQHRQFLPNNSPTRLYFEAPNHQKFSGHKKQPEKSNNKRSNYFHGAEVLVEGAYLGECWSQFRFHNCFPSERFTQTAKKYLNFTRRFMLYNEITDYVQDVKRHENISTLMLSENYRKNEKRVTISSGPYIRDFEEFFLLYCENEINRSTSSYSYWISPFDANSWYMIILSILISSLLASRGRGYQSHRGLSASFSSYIICLFSVVATFLRQNARIKSRFLQIFIHISALIISFQYESIVTGDITVPPPPVVAQNLKELIIDRGFKILYPVWNQTDLAKFDLLDFRNGFAKHNMSSELNSSIQILNPGEVWKEESLANKSNFVATDISKTESEAMLLRFRNRASGRYCHIVPEPFFQRTYATYVRGHGFQRILDLMRLTRENGLESFWNRNHFWAKNMMEITRLFKKQNATINLENDATNVLKLSGKINQIFEIWIFGLGFSVLILVIEVVLDCFSEISSIACNLVVSFKRFYPASIKVLR